jgi:hypothetical protein
VSRRRTEPFAVKDCALLAIATGRRAETLKELRDRLLDAAPSSIYQHFWGHLLEAQFEEPEYNNDFAAWGKHGLHDGTLAERLAVVDPTHFPDIEGLRQEVLEIVEQRLDESEMLAWVKAEHPFEFTRSTVVVFRTPRELTRPRQLAIELGHFSTGSIFYHFIDARRRREDGMDDFRGWLRHFGSDHEDLVEILGEVDPYFITLTRLRAQLASIFQQYFEVDSHGRSA